MRDILLSQLRDVQATRGQFRDASEKLGMLMAAEVASCLERELFSVTTPMGVAQGARLKNKVVLVPILRSGIVLFNAFTQLFPGASVGFVGMRRDEKTAIPKQYYLNLPPIGPHDTVLVLDPMIATGGSGAAALSELKHVGVQEEKIIFVGIIASQVGFAYLQSSFPAMNILVACQDEKLDDNKCIVPGLGDFGDRYFGTG